jgi:hypothetical protein
MRGEVYRKGLFDTRTKRQDTEEGRGLAKWKGETWHTKDWIKWSERDS